MDKEIIDKVLQRSNGLCEIEGCNSNQMVQLHHIIKGQGKRRMKTR